MIQTAHESGEILLALINDVLDYSKIEAGKLRSESTRFDLGEMVSRTCGLFSSQARAKNLGFSLDIDPELNTLMIGDSNKWRQILINFIGNALKFTREGAITVEVKVLEQDSRQARISLAVRDTGIGIPSAKQKGIFDPFSQADSSTTKEYGGSGLGLTISKRLVEIMGGKIGVNSKGGKGSEFWIEVTLNKDSAKIHRVNPFEKLLEHEDVFVISDSSHDPLIEQAMSLSCVRSFVFDEGESIDHNLAVLDQETEKLEGELSFVFIDTHLALVENVRLAKKVRSLVENPKLAIIFVIENIVCDEEIKASLADHYYTLLKPLNEIDFRMSFTQILSKEKSYRRNTVQIAELPPPLGMRLLLVEDNIVNQQVATALIKKSGCEVVVARNGRIAVDLFNKDDFDMIFMDCQMPVLDGYQATREIRNLEELQNSSRRVPIVALTANAVSGDRERALESGMDDYLAKPYGQDQLYEMIRKIKLMSTQSDWKDLSGDGPFQSRGVDAFPDSLDSGSASEILADPAN